MKTAILRALLVAAVFAASIGVGTTLSHLTEHKSAATRHDSVDFVCESTAADPLPVCTWKGGPYELRPEHVKWLHGYTRLYLYWNGEKIR